MVYYPIAEHKNLSDPVPRPLPELHEARGQLLRVFEAEGQCVGVWAWGCCSFPAELAGELAGMVGKECAILRLDGKYHIRAAK